MRPSEEAIDLRSPSTDITPDVCELPLFFYWPSTKNIVAISGLIKKTKHETNFLQLSEKWWTPEHLQMYKHLTWRSFGSAYGGLLTNGQPLKKLEKLILQIEHWSGIVNAIFFYSAQSKDMWLLIFHLHSSDFTTIKNSHQYKIADQKENMCHKFVRLLTAGLSFASLYLYMCAGLIATVYMFSKISSPAVLHLL